MDEVQLVELLDGKVEIGVGDLVQGALIAAVTLPRRNDAAGRVGEGRLDRPDAWRPELPQRSGAGPAAFDHCGEIHVESLPCRHRRERTAGYDAIQRR